MKTKCQFLGIIILVLSMVMVAGGGSTASNLSADSPLELTLINSSLKNVDDIAGRYQYAGGKVYENEKYIAQFASAKRVVYGGTDIQNTAMLTITIFFLGKKPVANITLQGSHDFDSGKQIGSVSAASKQYSHLIGKPFSGTNDAIVIER